MEKDYLRPTDPQPRVDTREFDPDEDDQKKHLIRQSFGMLASWAKTRPTARLYEGSVHDDDHKMNNLERRRAKNKIARKSRRINRHRS